METAKEKEVAAPEPAREVKEVKEVKRTNEAKMESRPNKTKSVSNLAEHTRIRTY